MGPGMIEGNIPSKGPEDDPPTGKNRLKRLFTISGMAPIAGSIAAFVLVMLTVQSNFGFVLATIVGGAVGAVTWWLMDAGEARGRLQVVLANLPSLGTIPTDNTSHAPALGTGDTADAYFEVARALESQTVGNVFVFTSPSPGQGSTTVALNVAIAATRAGRRVMLIDGDTSPHGVSRYLSTGATPGLTELALGESTVAEASRLLSIDEQTRLPILASGAPTLDDQVLSSVAVANALDAVASRADFVIIDAPPVGWADATPHLAAHADGSILVVSDSADAEVVSSAGAKLSQVGAPVLAYIANRTERSITPFSAIWKPFSARLVLTALVLGAAFSVLTGAQLWNSWASIERESYSLARAESLLAIGAPTTTTVGAQGTPVGDATPTSTTVPPIVEPYETFLLIGEDDDSGASDVILYLVMPTNDAPPFMISFPRDLYVDNPCTGGKSRINSMSHGCPSKGINGGTLLSVQVSEMTGINVDHFAEFRFEGFMDIIDAVGGIEICVEYAVKDNESELDLPAGCTNATGAQALGWVRSRNTLEFRDGGWRSIPGRGDLMRNVRQQDVILELAAALKDFDSPQQLTQTVASVANAFTLSDTISITDAISLAWSVRSIDLENIQRLEIPVVLGRSPTNQSILRATQDVKELISDAYGDTLLPEGDPG
jgi:LCP family protein required for cell wall assembly